MRRVVASCKMVHAFLVPALTGERPYTHSHKAQKLLPFGTSTFTLPFTDEGAAFHAEKTCLASFHECHTEADVLVSRCVETRDKNDLRRMLADSERAAKDDVVIPSIVCSVDAVLVLPITT